MLRKYIQPQLVCYSEWNLYPAPCTGKLCQFAKYFFNFVFCLKGSVFSELENISHAILHISTNLQTEETTYSSLHTCDWYEHSAEGFEVWREQEDAFCYFHFLSQQPITLVSSLAISDIDFLHTQDCKKKKNAAELCTETVKRTDAWLLRL